MIDEKFITEWIACQEGNLDNDDPDLHWTDEYLVDLSITVGKG
jgi:hypothetical protein